MRHLDLVSEPVTDFILMTEDEKVPGVKDLAHELQRRGYPFADAWEEALAARAVRAWEQVQGRLEGIIHPRTQTP